MRSEFVTNVALPAGSRLIFEPSENRLVIIHPDGRVLVTVQPFIIPDSRARVSEPAA